ncbi:3-oxoacyl-ACP reductase [Methylobacterium variabile]|jgi:NAD(P)-dependent dehydrogenase (short-subunit alcohol dehydrogenase family)|uniref:3-oxoacyl-ACP reductase n=1 Tax=Methylobacterium variabile TaxID=298794 RepID=A0A0J6SS80_9HYPH|nr:SDR family NAD(P)-dependent oxidoreductase [Methylobacterium variabile]KMO36238.1 3-oxoacyl-ACP reductase [Methylobacterium variabile]
MAGKLEGRVAIVTGAGSIGEGWGNGKAASVLFAREGATVVALDINPTAAEETCRLIREEGGSAMPFVGDVARDADVKALVEATLRAHGRIDILHNNVGINRTAATTQLSEADWDLVMAVNLKSMFLTCRAVLPIMEKQGRGAIVNVSSVAALRYARIPYLAYSTSKGAILPFTRTIALEYAKRGVRANVILPGLMDTPMVWASMKDEYPGGREAMVRERNAQVPMGRMGDAWDVARAALFLASDDARFITGAELVVDGGMSCSTG